MQDLGYASISEVAPRLASGQLSPVELTEEARRAEEEIRRGRYRGPLHGIPIGHKDLLYTHGIRTTAGSRVLRDFVPDHDATVVRKLREAGTILLGKLKLHEFAAGGISENHTMARTC